MTKIEIISEEILNQIEKFYDTVIDMWTNMAPLNTVDMELDEDTMKLYIDLTINDEETQNRTIYGVYKLTDYSVEHLSDELLNELKTELFKAIVVTLN